ncbi:MAG: indolepyruvate ferredoxin oxidoreductase [Spirochaetaceae bacterium]|jgi:indolepyruvate ferredoxin oxidoreductase alpha subunit|nr:indolepyruvate ferredoxin oxidoreductase [Spirochaetaceae bacterium]
MQTIVLGDEALAQGALDAGLFACYGYPGTPSTEIMEFLIDRFKRGGKAVARWCVNEKTALEGALGVSFAGRRAMVTMKHVGLNVAADPFINGALLGIRGGLVIAVADDPGMHSSQNEQDSRFYADFALLPALEPRSQQEAYDMAREAFELSEKHHVPVLIRLVTRLSHARSAVETSAPLTPARLGRARDTSEWMLLPAFARRNYVSLIEKSAALSEWARAHGANKLETERRDASFAVITAGLGGNYYDENFAELAEKAESGGGAPPARLHIGVYPIPADSVRKLCKNAKRLLVIEEGQPFVEAKLRGILPPSIEIDGKLNGKLPRSGELDPDNVRPALGLPPARGIPPAGLGLPSRPPAGLVLPSRPPQLCKGCPHADSYAAINAAVAVYAADDRAVLSDIGCYSLGASPPHSAIESIVCMGASISMARGAAEAGIKAAVAVIGDSTFLHSGMTAIVDAVSFNAPLTVVILDNSTVAMTGCQETALPPARLRPLLLGLGVDAAHIAELEPLPKNLDANTARLAAEIEYRGLSVVIFRRECLESIRRNRSGT